MQNLIITERQLYMMIALIIIVVLILLAAGLYNSLVSGRNRVDEAWSDINVQLKRRYDLIPNLVETVKGYARQESSVLENVTKARANAMNASGMTEKLQDENQLSGALKTLFAVSENYPDLKSNQNFLSLQGDLTDTEDKIQAARRFYNGNVRDLNTKIEVFPSNIIAGMFSFAKMEFFQLDENSAAKEPVEVKF